MKRCRALLLATGVAALATLCGCGSTKPNPAREARLVAKTDALCASIGRRVHPSRTQSREAQHHLAVMLKALSDTWAYLPAGRSLNEAVAKRRALNVQARKLEKSATFGSAANYLEQSYRLELQIYDDAKSLGLTRCLGRPPRPPIGG